MVELDVLGLTYCTSAAVPYLLAAAQDGPRQVADMVDVSPVVGRVARADSGGYNATKVGVGAFSESLRQELTERHVRVSLLEPGAVTTELARHDGRRSSRAAPTRYAGMERLPADDIDDAVTCVVTRPRHVRSASCSCAPPSRRPDLAPTGSEVVTSTAPGCCGSHDVAPP